MVNLMSGPKLILRPYQAKLVTDVQLAWATGHRNVLMRLGTGGGKTVILAWLIQQHRGASAVIAHRQELVSQLSLTLAAHGVRHNIIASQKVRRQIIAAHILLFGRSFFEAGSQCVVASVDTLIRAEGLEAWFAQVTLWIVDEAHHVVEDNKWHTCVTKFTNQHCVGLGPTATPKRADGKGLGRWNDGVFDTMVQGPSEQWLMDQGYLTTFKIFCPDSDLQVLVEVGSTGDWSNKQLKEAAQRSHIVGDVVLNYQKFAAGMTHVTFATDVETALAMAEKYRQAGIRAECIHGDTDPTFRAQTLKLLERGEIRELVAVDIVSEGFDLPALQAGSMARPTNSLSLFMQQFGRLLRPIYAPGFDLETQAGRLAAIAASVKPYAILIDHVANTIRHQGPPNKWREWNLERRGNRSNGAPGIPMTNCGAGHTKESKADLERQGLKPCYQPFMKTETECPHCGYPLPIPTPQGRTSPVAVDGDLAELDAETLARLCAPANEIDMSPEDYGAVLTAKRMPPIGIAAQINRQRANKEAQATLRATMTEFVRLRLAEGMRDRQIHKAFFMLFGVDVISARGLPKIDAEDLTQRIREYG